MSQASVFTANSLAAHLVCAGAGVRDSLRAAQFYARDLANADGRQALQPRQAPWLSRLVGWMARTTDGFMTWGARKLLALLLPSWRNLPSPFDPAVINEVTHAIAHNSFIHNPRFNAYYFRAANHIIERFCDGPSLVLEHRVDAARRSLTAQTNHNGELAPFLSRTLIALARHGAVARTGNVKPGQGFFSAVDPNVAVFAIASVALLFASVGKPSEAMNEDEFFDVTGALIGPRLPQIAALVAAGDETKLANQLLAIREMY